MERSLFKKYLRLTLLFSVFIPLIASPAFAENYRLKQIISGDTLLLDNGQTVKLIGINTADVEKKYRELGPPKTGAPIKPYYSAESYIRDTVGEAPIEIEFDNSVERKDSSGNLFAYVYIIVPKEARSAFEHTSVVPEIIKEYASIDSQFVYDKKTQRIFLNASLICSGNATALTDKPFKFTEDFKKYEAEARSAGRGMWP